ncbi:MAG: M56 family metallopeptidase [Candidatus Hydrogenedentales bacterium]|jgi:prepilin-type processing-associated H-X9-DG protein
MTNAWAFFEGAFLRVLNVSWQAALLILLIVIVQRLLRGRINATVRHAMWGLVLVRLLLLWSVPAPFSLYNAVQGTVELFASNEEATPQPLLYVDGTLVPAASAESALAAKASSSTPARVVPAPEALSPAQDGPWHFAMPSLWLIGAGVWLAGAVTVVTTMIMQGRSLAKRVARQRLVVEPKVLEQIEDCKQRMGVNTWLAVVVTPCVEGPALLGAIRPRLLLPPALLESAPSEHLRYVFLHELAHLKRGDILIGWLVNVLLAVHWFNPLLWWARNRVAADRELACDAHVLSVLDSEERRGYGHALLDQFQKFRPPAWSPGLAGVLEGKTNMERRIAMVTRFSESSRWSKAFAVCVLALFGVIVLTDAQEPPADVSITPDDVFTFVADNGGRMIAGTITNSSPKDLEVAISFYEGDPDAGGKKINTGALVVPAGGKATEAISWAANPGTYTIYAQIDPENAIAESDEANNRVKQEVTVAGGGARRRGGIGMGAPGQAGMALPPAAGGRRSAQDLGEMATLPPGRGGIAVREKGFTNPPKNLDEAFKQIGLAFKMYSAETQGERFPLLCSEPGLLMADLNVQTLGADGKPGRSLKTLLGEFTGGVEEYFDIKRCAYLGFALVSDDEVVNFAEAYTKELARAGGDINQDLPNPLGTLGPEKFYRLREGIERFFITDINNPAAPALAQSQIPLLIEWPDQNKPKGGHVLFMDGHVEFMEFPGKFPMTEATINTLRQLAKLPPIGAAKM